MYKLHTWSIYETMKERRIKSLGSLFWNKTETLQVWEMFYFSLMAAIESLPESAILRESLELAYNILIFTLVDSGILGQKKKEKVYGEEVEVFTTTKMW